MSALGCGRYATAFLFPVFLLQLRTTRSSIQKDSANGGTRANEKGSAETEAVEAPAATAHADRATRGADRGRRVHDDVHAPARARGAGGPEREEARRPHRRTLRRMARAQPRYLLTLQMYLSDADPRVGVCALATIDEGL